MKKTVSLLLCVTMLVCFMPTVAWADGGGNTESSTYYVDDDGSDTNPGTEAAPFANIQKAVNTAKDGDTIIVEEGSYNVWCPTTDSNNYTGRDHNLFIGKNITIKGEGEVNIYSLQETYQYSFDRLIVVLISGSNGVVLENLNIYPVYYSTPVNGLPSIENSKINIISGCQQLSMYYNQIIDTMMNYNGIGITSEKTISNVTIRGCTVGDPALDPALYGSAIYLPGYVVNATNQEGISGGYTIEKNTFYGHVCICEGASENATSAECQIKDNIFYGGIIFNGKRNTGWNYVSLTVFPEVTGNTFMSSDWTITNKDGVSYQTIIGSRDEDSNYILTQEQLNEMAENNFLGGSLKGKKIRTAIGVNSANAGDEHHAIVYIDDPAAKIGNVEYDSLPAAIGAATDGQTVTLLKDVEIDTPIEISANKTLTLDLNGKKLSMKSGTPLIEYPYMIKNSGNLTINANGGTITNGKTQDEVIAAGAGNTEAWRNILNNAGGKLTVNGGTYIGFYNIVDEGTAVINNADMYGSFSNIFKKAGSFELNGSTLYADYYNVSNNGLYGGHTTRINNCTMTSTEDTSIFKPSSDAMTITNTIINGKGSGIEVYAGKLYLKGNTVVNNTEEAYKDFAAAKNRSKSDGSIEEGSAVIIGSRPGYKTATDVVFDAERTVRLNSTNGACVRVLDFTESNTAENTYANNVSISVYTNSYGTQAKGTLVKEPETETGNVKYNIDEKTYVAPGPGTSIPTDNVTNSGTAGTDSATTSADLSGSTSTSNGTTTSTVDKTTADKIVDKAVANKSKEIVIDATANSTTAANSTTTAQVSIPTDTLLAIAEKTEADVTIRTDVAEVKLDNASAAAVANQAEGDTVQIIAVKVAEETDKVEFELKVVCSNGKVISDFKGGNAAVTVALPKTMAEKKLVCVYIDEDGRYHKTGGTLNADGTFTFAAEQSGTYAVMAEEEADSIITKQEAEYNAYLKKGVENTTLKIYSEKGKGYIRLRWVKSKGFKVDGYEVYRGTKKSSMKKYGTTKKTSYTNRNHLKKGQRYYYKVRGYRVIEGEKVYTRWSKTIYRIAK